MKKILNIFRQKQGPERRQEIFNMIDDKSTFLPKGVYHEDLDYGFKEFVKNKLKVIIDGEIVPVFFFSQERWSEITQTWKFTDKYENIKIPFVAITREYNPDIVQNPLWYNIPIQRKYVYKKIKVWDGNRKGFDLYKIPYPIPLTLNYEIKFFSYKIKDLNEFNKIFLTEFASRQSYCIVNGNYFPIFKESITDESNLQDINAKKFFTQNYKVRMDAFLLDEKEFEITPVVNRNIALFEIIETNYDSLKNKETNNFTSSEISAAINKPTQNAPSPKNIKTFFGVYSDDILNYPDSEVENIAIQNFSYQFTSIVDQVKEFNCTVGKYIYFLLPISELPLTFKIANLTGPFIKAIKTFVSNGETYTVYRSLNKLNGESVLVDVE